MWELRFSLLLLDYKQLALSIKQMLTLMVDLDMLSDLVPV